MPTTRYEQQGLRGIGVIWALAAALLASACGGGSSGPVTEHSGAVTVQGPPDGTPCSAANGVGIAGDADANHVAVTCSEQLYTLSGVISGLTRAGLALANGAHIVRVAPNATSFTLPAPLAHTNRYAVTVASQPAGLTCSVRNGSGSMPASNVTNVRVKCLDTDTVDGTAGALNTTGLVLFLGLARSTRLR